jgi:aminoglycoside phosphotransferase (APT) family kinase protein
MTEAQTGTKPISESHAFDVAALQAYLELELDGFEGPLQVEQFKGGQSNPTYKLNTPTRSYVMRSKPGPSAKLLASAHAIDREFTVMRALHATDVPVPRMYILCLDESVIGRAFYVMEYMAGLVMWDQSIPGADPTRRAKIYDEMNLAIAAMHCVDIKAVGLENYGRPGNYFERQIGRWTKQYQASITQPIPEMERLIEWLPANIPASARDESQVSIVHGDYRLDNVMFHRSEPRAIAILDWELSTVGHPLADLSYHCMPWHVPTGQSGGIGGLDLTALGIPDEKSYVRRYCERTGRSDPDAVMADWNFYLAYNMFRLAGILQGIAKRVEMGTASSAQARQASASARPLAQMGWALAQCT